VQNGNSKNLLLDADDTLWENNIYFERVISKVAQMLEPFSVSPDDFRAYLNETEHRSIALHGYGTRNFTRSLVIAFEHFAASKTTPALQSEVRDLGMSILNHPMRILDGVPETLQYLAERHRLHLVTKGNEEEQTRKIEDSGLKRFFHAVTILSEKNVASYRGLIESHSWDPPKTWMIGNSPRSDINPALQAGINAVYIPREPAWLLEHEEPARHPCLIELEKFADLRAHF
jgi:putative hydrolase of the HAD superfamily